MTLNGPDWSNSGVLFSVYDLDAARISSVVPSGGPASGNTAVTVHGVNFRGPGVRGEAGRLPRSSVAKAPRAQHAVCTWCASDDAACHAECATPAPCAAKTAASWLDSETLVCVSPPAHVPPSAGRSFALEVSFDGHHYTALNRTFDYFEPAGGEVATEHLDPIGGPSAGGTSVLVLGRGFRRMGGAPSNTTCDSGATFEPDVRSHRYEPSPCLDGAHCLFGADPLHGNFTSWSAATVVSPTRLRCVAPRFSGTFTDGFMPVPVSVVLNGDAAARIGVCGVVGEGLCVEALNFTYYDAAYARLTGSDTTGGPLEGGTWVRLRGRHFADFRRQSGDLVSSSEVAATNQAQARAPLSELPRALTGVLREGDVVYIRHHDVVGPGTCEGANLTDSGPLYEWNFGDDPITVLNTEPPACAVVVPRVDGVDPATNPAGGTPGKGTTAPPWPRVVLGGIEERVGETIAIGAMHRLPLQGGSFAPWDGLPRAHFDEWPSSGGYAEAVVVNPDERELGGGRTARLATPYDGETSEGGAWAVHCRFGEAGLSQGVLLYESGYALDEETMLMRPANYSIGWAARNATTLAAAIASGLYAADVPSKTWDAIPAFRVAGRPEPVIWCQAPRLHGTGHATRVEVSVMLNGQDLISAGAPRFTYYRRDRYDFSCADDGGGGGGGGGGGAAASSACLGNGGAYAFAADYRGNASTTVSGLTCLSWETELDARHTFTPANFPDAGLGGGHSQCRAPGGLRNGRPWCYVATNSSSAEWEACSIGEPRAPVSFRGAVLESIQPFGGPAEGGTLVTISGRNLDRLAAGPGSTAAYRATLAPTLCNFGNGSSDAAPLGGPARGVRDGAGAGSLPWHVRATILSSTQVVCRTPPAPVAPHTLLSAAVDVSLSGQLADLGSSGLAFSYYSGDDSYLNLTSIYPIAGHKEGGSVVTLYGTGFDTLGEPGAGLSCLFGSAAAVEAATLHPIGSVAAVAALGLEESDPIAPLAAAITCVAPAYLEDGMQCDSPKRVCVMVTLNGDRNQNTSDCVPFTYFDG